jgi:multidrug efflux pump
MAVSTLLSAFNSLTLSPALCPLFLKPHAKAGEHHRRDPLEWLTHILLGWWFFRGFNWFFDKITNLYGWTIGKMLRISLLILLVYFGLLALTGWFFGKLPGGFIPQQDQGYLVINVQLPDGASVERSAAVVRKIDDICLGPIGPDGKRDRSKGIKGIDHVTGLAGYSIFASANISNAGGAYLSLSPFEERKGRHADAILADLNAKLAQIQEGRVQAFGAPPILGLGNAGGFKMQVKDTNNLGPGVLEGMTWNLCFAAMKEPGIPAAFSNYTSGGPVLAVTIDSDRCFRLGVSDKDVKDAMQVYLGSLYVNDVTLENRNWQVNVMADAAYRSRKDDIGKLKVRSNTGEMVSLGGLIYVSESNGPTKVNRYNMKPAADVNGFTIPFLISSGNAIAKMEQIAARDLPAGMDFEWTDMAYQQSKAANTVVRIPGIFEFKGDTTLLVFGLSTLLAYLILAFLYESFLLPLAVVLIVPMCLLAAAVGLFITQLDLNIFTQIGLVVLVGLASKNAILIVEFAKQKREEGLPRWEAAVEASRSRLRPILMTSFAFILGVLPLVIAKGAGAEMRRALGTAVFAGMIGVTIFGLFLTPVFYVLLQRLRDRKPNTNETPH